MPVLNPPPAWATTASCSRFVVLWPGCLRSQLRSIRQGVDPSLGKLATDFGRGFYTTTIRRQARQWAWHRFRGLPLAQRKADGPVLLRFRVPLDRLARLESLHFVLGDYDQDRYWSLVYHCRSSTSTRVNTHLHPGRQPPDDWYDVVWGPVAAFWRQRVAMVGADQVSFHSPRAARLLNRLMRSRDPEDFRAFRVRRRRRGRRP